MFFSFGVIGFSFGVSRISFGVPIFSVSECKGTAKKMNVLANFRYLPLTSTNLGYFPLTSAFFSVGVAQFFGDNLHLPGRETMCVLGHRKLTESNLVNLSFVRKNE